MNHTLLMPDAGSHILSAEHLDVEARAAAAAFIAAGIAANTVRSYRSALAYWSGWLQLRYGRTLEIGDGRCGDAIYRGSSGATRS